ncbi:Transcription factor SPEECHLESS [Zea mays]|uniref:Transcription factor SPEECHLESS n=1 Tax=Zea mays TaxID=4577 RepID=A0A3L6F4N9_MAIZE|nr:Transcription factor SPEECHLESS [Zea mays]
MEDGGMCELVIGDHRELRHRLSGAEDLFSIVGTWEERTNGASGGGGGGGSSAAAARAYSQGCTAGTVGAKTAAGTNSRRRTGDEEKGGSAPAQKKHKGSSAVSDDEGAAKMSHITVERNRRKQMNEHLAVLRSLMPCFYVKRGDQASIIGGVVDYIKELQQVLRSLETKKHRKAYAEQVLSPRPLPAVKSTPPLSPHVAVPMSPRTPTPGSPYKPASGAAATTTGSCRLPHRAAAAAAAAYIGTPTTSSSSSSYSHDQQRHYSTYLPTLDSLVTELAAQAAACSRPAASAGLNRLPDVKVEFAGPNLVLKTVSHRSPGQALKIIAALESLPLEILHVSVSTVDDTMVHSFTIKIGIECELSAEELVQEIQQTLL